MTTVLEIVKLWFLYNVQNQLHTAPQSPDLNPIEHLWYLLEHWIYPHYISSKDMLYVVLKDEGEKIIQFGVNSVAKRLQEVLKRPGYPTSFI
ncbi:transposable element Tcb1 transposase [Trichonephila clavipes]|nr:transposable element Tcb1 transposase [Trichonephila clavipes]